jgi:hypothetical protein
MTDSSDIVTRLMTAYDNMGTATRDDLKEAADAINDFREKAISGNSVVIALVRALAEATGEEPQAIFNRYRWANE